MHRAYASLNMRLDLCIWEIRKYMYNKSTAFSEKLASVWFVKLFGMHGSLALCIPIIKYFVCPCLSTATDLSCWRCAMYFLLSLMHVHQLKIKLRNESSTIESCACISLISLNFVYMEDLIWYTHVCIQDQLVHILLSALFWGCIFDIPGPAI